MQAYWARVLAVGVASLFATAQAQQKGAEPAVTMSTEVVATDGIAGYTTYQVKVTFGPKAQDVYALVSCWVAPAAACPVTLLRHR
jgi:hypothetical protein